MSTRVSRKADNPARCNTPDDLGAHPAACFLWKTIASRVRLRERNLAKHPYARNPLWASLTRLGVVTTAFTFPVCIRVVCFRRVLPSRPVI